MSNQKLDFTRIVSLVIMVIAIVVGWIAYHNYQPKLLERYELTRFSFFLVCAQGVILILTPPLAGYLGDRFRERGGQRFRIISLGVGFAAMIFMTVALGLTTLPANLVIILLPVLVVFWLVAMNIFTSPAISTFELFSPFEKQPMAIAILTLTAELLYALEPVIVPIIDALGGALTFLTGGVLVTVAGVLLRRATKDLPDGLKDASGPETTAWREILLSGARLGIPTALVFNIWPDLFDQKLGGLFTDITGSWVVSAMLALSAVVCLPFGNIADRVGVKPAQRLAFTGILVATLLIIGPTQPWLVIIGVVLFALMFSMQSVSSLPFALTRIAPHQKVLGVGVFFAGVEIPNAIIEIYLGYMEFVVG
ncbi:MAG: MFS transporter [Bacteroidota bacterium]